MAMLIVSATWAQSSLTFQVDMAGLTVSANGVHIAGDFQSAAGAPGNWDPAATALTQVGTTTIYSVTVSVPNGNYQYKYLNGNAWGDDEGIPAASQVSAGLGFDNGNSNRWVHVTGTDTTAAVMFAGNAPAGHSAVSMVLDMGLEASIDSVVSIAGNFQGWSPGSTELYDLLADSMYRFIAYIPTTDTMNFKYVNGSAWGDDESVPSGCQVNNNRQLIISGDTVFGPTCYAQCGPCFVPDTFNVTIQVDMSGASCSFDPATDSVDFAGPYNSWGGGDYLTDPDGDMIYDITVYVPSPEFTYKARIIKGGSPTWEPGGNNVVTFIGDTLVPARCFGVATAGACPPQPNPSDLTFQVDMSNGPASFVKVFLIGDFTDPQWQGGAIELTASATQPGVFETTVLQVCPGKISFKYMIEDGTGTQIEESFLAASDTTCLEPSGTGDFNRFYQRPDDQPKTIAAPWEDCASSIGLGENLGTSVNIYPNPSKGITNIELPTGKHQVRIYNLIGSVVASFNDVENNLQWNAGNLTTGVYVVSVTNELGFTATQKVVLK